MAKLQHFVLGISGLALAASLPAFAAHAAEPPAAEPQLSEAQDAELTNLVGANFSVGEKIDSEPEKPDDKSECLPPNIRLQGLKRVDGKLLVHVRNTGDSYKYFLANVQCEGKRTTENLTRDGFKDYSYKVIKLDEKKLIKSPIYRTGWVGGLLFVPYKYHINKGGSLKASESSMGGYLGYEYNTWEVQYKFIGFAGPSSVATEATQTTPSQNLSTVSVGVGTLVSFPFAKNVQTGIVLGWDLAGGDKPVPKDTGRPWLAISFGYNFSR